MDLQRNNLDSLSVVACSSNATASYHIANLYRTVMDQLNPMEFLNNVIPVMDYNPMLWSLVGAIIVGLSGIFPLLVIPIEEGANLNKGASGRTLKVLLSFAVGGLLGDVFLHLLPEAWGQQIQSSETSSMFCGMWVLAGLLVFIIAEKAFSFPKDDDEGEDEKEAADEDGVGESSKCADSKAREVQWTRAESSKHKVLLNNNISGDDDFQSNKNDIQNGYHRLAKSSSSSSQQLYKEKQQPSSVVLEKKIPVIKMSGYLNLLANSVDNFSHGLAVGGSFVLSLRVGVLSTVAILVHEVPHEVGDFAILLRAGFTRWQAAKAQLCTASASLLGAYTAVACSGISNNSIEARTSWILPFTAGGFLHIALVTVLPELLREENPKESLKQMASLISGILVMAALSVIVE